MIWNSIKRGEFKTPRISAHLYFFATFIALTIGFSIGYLLLLFLGINNINLLYGNLIGVFLGLLFTTRKTIIAIETSNKTLLIRYIFWGEKLFDRDKIDWIKFPKKKSIFHNDRFLKVELRSELETYSFKVFGNINQLEIKNYV